IRPNPEWVHRRLTRKWKKCQLHRNQKRNSMRRKLMSHTKWLTIATATLLAGMTVGPSAFAKHGMQNGSMDQQNMTGMWNKLDANHDGSVSMSEHQRYADQ